LPFLATPGLSAIVTICGRQDGFQNLAGDSGNFVAFARVAFDQGLGEFFGLLAW
jgi:hypothetical protein